MQTILKRIYLLGTILSTVFVITCIAEAQTTQVKKAHTLVEIIPQYSQINEGQSFWIGLKLKTDKDWHTYWHNPGDSGLATSVKWEWPSGFKAGPIVWPKPDKIMAPPLVTYAYAEETFLSVKINAPAKFEDFEQVKVKAKVSWLACKVECIPGTAHFELTIPVSQEPPIRDNKFTEVYDRYKNKYPIKDVMGKTSVVQSDDSFIVRYIPTRLIPQIESGHFYAYDANVIDYADEQVFRPVKDGYEFVIKKSPLFDERKNDRFAGILVFNKENYEGIRPIEIDIGLDEEQLAEVGGENATNDQGNIIVAMMFAFVGGLILNLMPCVLPVLSIKVLSLVEKAGEDRKKLFSNGLQFSMGIIVSFWILAAIMLFLRIAGRQIGWGFQFQSPIFVVSMGLLFFVLALSLFGLFEIGVGFTRAKSTDYAFFNGMLATIVATPCTAPLMGSAIGYALFKPPIFTLIIFTCLGAGMAFPYFLLACNPHLLKFVPKPGSWMVQLKQFFGFMLLAVVIWLIWVLSLQKGSEAVILFLVGLFSVSLGIWIFSLQRKHIGAKYLIAALWLFGLYISFQAAQVSKTSVLRDSSQQSESGIVWQDYTPAVLDSYLKTNQPVFLDFTAAWCLSCQVNDQVVFHHPKIVSKFKQYNIVPIKADWTNHDPAITAALNAFGKNSIPLYVLYPRDKRKKPIILPELITPGLVADTLDKNLID